MSGSSVSVRSWSWPHSRVGPRSLARALSLATVVGVMLAFYAWTAATSVGPNVADRPATSSSLGSTTQPIDPSNRLADAMLHGRLSLDMPIPRGLRTARDIGDPAQRGYLSSDYLDLSYDNGKLYTYWGPVPVLTFFLPARALGFGFVSQALGVLLFSMAAFLLSVALLWTLVRRYTPTLPHWALLTGVAVLGSGNLLPYILRRPEIYELAIAAALCFALGALLWFVSGILRERPSAWRIALGSLFAGLAFGSRVPSGSVLAIGMAMVGWRWWRVQRPERRELLSVVAALVAPFAVCALAYGLYNSARFGSALEFGDHHQLTANFPPLETRHGSGNVIPGLWYYLLALPRLRVQFPYLWLPPGPFPGFVNGTYGPVEPTAGILPTLPIVALLALAPWALRRQAGDLKLFIGALSVLGVVLLVFLSFLIATASMRYEVDFRTVVLVAALLVWFAGLVAVRTRRRRRWLASAGIALALWGIVVSASLSFVGEKNRFVQLHPGTYGAFSRFFSPLPTVVAQVRGHPLIGAVGATPDLAPWGYDRVSIDGTSFGVGVLPVTLQVVSPDTGVHELDAVLTRSPVVPDSMRLRVGVSANRTGQFGTPAGRSAGFPILLKQGLNEVRIEVAYSASSLTDQQQAGLVELSDVRVR